MRKHLDLTITYLSLLWGDLLGFAIGMEWRPMRDFSRRIMANLKDAYNGKRPKSEVLKENEDLIKEAYKEYYGNK